MPTTCAHGYIITFPLVSMHGGVCNARNQHMFEHMVRFCKAGPHSRTSHLLSALMHHDVYQPVLVDSEWG